MGAPRWRCERRRDCQNLRARCAQATKQLREADVITDGQPDLANGGVNDRGARAWCHIGRLAIFLGLTRDVDIKEMDLVVASDPVAGSVVDEGGCGHSAVS